MSVVASPPNPCLVAILLVVQSRIGQSSQIAFHYPPEPLSPEQVESRAPDRDAAVTDPFSSSDSDESSSSEDDLNVLNKTVKPTKSQVTNPQFRLVDEDDEVNPNATADPDDRPWIPPWEPFLGFGEDGLVALLTPGRAWHKTKFQMTINDIAFVGRPVYAREDGLWRKPRSLDWRYEEHDVPSHDDMSTSHSEAEDDHEENTAAPDSGQRSRPQSQPGHEKSQLTMFHVVFVMTPPSLEHQFRVKDMYDNVAKKFSKVLKHEQAHSDYVLKQVDLIQSIKNSHFGKSSSASELYSDLLRGSSLATAIAGIFNAISTSRIAAVTLGSKRTVSLQIPPITSTPYLPSLNDPPIQPGLWLTTADDLASPNDLDSTAPLTPVQAAKCLTLLLKSTPQKILKDITAGGGAKDPILAQFVNRLNPSKSFYKTSVETKMSLQDIQFLARHLIYWRRAVAIPPLHHRDTYIVSPNADLSRLKEATREFETSFPMVPSLPRILSVLSEAPMPYQKLIPSTDHKDEYYKVLAWLMRGGWVTQLRTFAFVRVGPEIKRGVREQEGKSPVSREDSERPSFSNRRVGDRSIADKDERSSYQSRRPGILSHSSSERHSTSASSTDGRDAQGHINPNHASLIMSPLRASPREARWMEHIRDKFSSANLADRTGQSVGSTSTMNPDSTDLGKSWAMTVKHFNGVEPLERVPMRENLKRKVVWDRLGRFGLRFEGGVENGDDKNDAVLVTVRHW